MGIGIIRGHTTTRRPIDKSAFYKIWFIDILDRAWVFSNSSSKCIQPDRSAIEFTDHRQNVTVSNVVFPTTLYVTPVVKFLAVNVAMWSVTLTVSSGVSLLPS